MMTPFESVLLELEDALAYAKRDLNEAQTATLLATEKVKLLASWVDIAKRKKSMYDFEQEKRNTVE